MTTRIAAALVLAVLLCPVPGFGQTAQVVQQDKTIDVARFKTYSYAPGHPAIRQDVDKRILAGIESQLAKHGLTKAASGPGDVVVSYHAVQREDVDLSTFDAQKRAGEAAIVLKVGTLAVDLKDAATGKLVWRAKADGALRGDAAAQMEAIDKAVAAVFEKYPAAGQKK